MIPRLLTPRILEALADTPVVFLTGARQTGKSTLARAIAAGDHPARYITFDDATALVAAAGDPEGFVAGLSGPVVLDEVQRVPDLFLAIKASVDTDRTPGRYLLTGSANAMMLPNLAQALVGRVEVLTLWPFSQSELEAAASRGPAICAVDQLFSTASDGTRPAPLPQWRGEGLGVVLPRILAGGYPEALERTAPSRRRAWFSAYVTTILQREVRDLASIEGLHELPRLLSLLGARAGGLLNYAELSRSSGVPQSTLKRYMALLEATFLIHTLPAWSANLSKRLVKSPKLLLNDTGLMAHLLGAGGERDLPPDSPSLGPLVETFAVQELRKHCSWSLTQPNLYHLRAQTGQEVDLVLEDARGRVVGVEVKSSATVSPADLKGLRFLQEKLGERFVRGIVLYAGREVVPFGERLHAAPLEGLWGATSQ